MPEYSCTLPTGKTIGKMWRRDQNVYAPGHAPKWFVGMYLEDEDPALVRILWFRVVLREGPEPWGYRPPDWHNRAHFRDPTTFEFQSA